MAEKKRDLLTDPHGPGELETYLRGLNISDVKKAHSEFDRIQHNLSKFHDQLELAHTGTYERMVRDTEKLFAEKGKPAPSNYRDFRLSDLKKDKREGLEGLLFEQIEGFAKRLGYAYDPIIFEGRSDAERVDWLANFVDTQTGAHAVNKSNYDENSGTYREGFKPLGMTALLRAFRTGYRTGEQQPNSLTGERPPKDVETINDLYRIMQESTLGLIDTHKQVLGSRVFGHTLDRFNPHEHAAYVLHLAQGKGLKHHNNIELTAMDAQNLYLAGKAIQSGNEQALGRYGFSKAQTK